MFLCDKHLNDRCHTWCESPFVGTAARVRRPAGSGPARLRLPMLVATLDSGRGRRTCAAAQATPLPMSQVLPFLDRPIFVLFVWELGSWLGQTGSNRPGAVRSGQVSYVAEIQARGALSTVSTLSTPLESPAAMSAAPQLQSVLTPYWNTDQSRNVNLVP
jgi:hypothetical protein